MPHHATAGTSHPTTCLVLRVPAHDTSVRVARHALRSLGGMVEESLITRGELVVSELVTNAIQHGSSDDDEVVLRLAVEGDEIIGAVTDHGPSFEPPTGPPELTRPGGLGLFIVSELVTHWSIDRGPEGNDVRFVLSA